MVNLCEFFFILHTEDEERVDRFLRILDNEDPIYRFARSWGYDSSVRTDDGVMIWGNCPWSDCDFWELGHGPQAGDTVPFEGRHGRPDEEFTLVTVPYLCKLWGMSAEGHAEEPGCMVVNDWSCDSEGNLEYRDSWPQFALDTLEEDPTNAYYARDVLRCLQKGQYSDEEAARIRREYADVLSEVPDLDY